MSRERLESLARALRADPAIPPDGTEVRMYGTAPVAFLVAAGAARRAAAYVYPDPGGRTLVIEVAELTIDGIEFHAQFTRDATTEERAAAEAGRRDPGQSYHVATVEPAHV